jgi:DNA mismatch repair protein MutS
MVTRNDEALETPMMRQYFSMKEKYAEEILFFRMGDFYEMFFDDARVAAEILGIALTSRAKDKERIPMAGVPVRAVDSYLPKLLKAGKRVAICEQTQDPKDARGLVERDVVRVVSPGTVTDEKLIGEKSNNYIASVVRDKDSFGLSWLDVSTGQFIVWESSDIAAVSSAFARLEPAECLLPESMGFAGDTAPALKRMLDGCLQTPYADSLFEWDTAHRSLTEHFGTRTLEGFGCEHLKLAVRAGGALLHYVAATQKDSLQHLTKVVPFQGSRHVPIDRATRLALELTERPRGESRGPTLLSAFDFTASSLGARRLRDWLLTPLAEVPEIVRRQEAVAELVRDGELRAAIRGILQEVHDIERIGTRISYRSANARDLVALSRTLGIVPRLRELASSREPRFLREAAERLAVPPGLPEEIARALVDSPPLATREGGIVRDGYDAELDELREIASQGTRWIARFQQEESQRTGIPSLKIGYNRVFGYYLEVTNTHRERIPQHYIRKQTLKNCERFVTSELKEYESKVLKASERSMELEYEIFVRLRDEAARHLASLQATAEAISEVDVVSTFAELAAERGYVRPTVDEGMELRIEDGRHPVLEIIPGAEHFVPNSVDLDADRSIMIITGPNMAGKSTYIRQVAILTLLAQAGSFIPARSAQIGIVDRIFTRVGAADDLARGQSTFMVEMNEMANILNNATARSLLVLDEVGRGTSTFDGVSLAWAITEHIAEHLGARTLFATHYHELTALAERLTNVRNHNFAVKEWNDDIVFLRKVVAGGSDKSYGIHVARLAGIPRRVIDRARRILAGLESQALVLDRENGDGLARATGERRATPRRGAEARASGEPVARQLDLFASPNDALLRELRELDTDRLTPLEALQILAELKRRLV